MKIRVVQLPCAIDEWDSDLQEYGPNSFCKPGPDIVDPLLTSETIARVRGYNEIQKSFSDRVIVTGSIILRNWVAPGSIVSCVDNQVGEYRGMIKNFSITINRESKDRISVYSSVVIEREKI